MADQEDYFPVQRARIKCYRTDLRHAPPGDLVFQTILIMAGAGILELNGARLPFAAPMVLCLNESESSLLRTPKPIEAQAVEFDPTWLNPRFTFTNLHSPRFQAETFNDVQDKYLLKPFLDRDNGYRGLIDCTPETIAPLRAILASIERELQGKPDGFWPCRSRSFLLQMLIFIANMHSLRKTEPIPSYGQADEQIQAIQAYLHHHFAEEIRIADLERCFALNRTTLARLFKEATGRTIMEYLRFVRLKTAASLLQETMVPVTEVATRVGYDDLSHFGRSFKEVYALTPSEYRDEYCWVMKR